MNTSKNTADCQTDALFAVYVIWCQKTDMHYVGITRQKVARRIRQHRRGKQFIDREIQRLGWDGKFDWWVVEENVPANLISECEQKWVALYDSVFPHGYNKTCGGISKLTVSDNTREIIRQNALARDMSGENNPMYGKHHTQEATETIRQAHLGKPSVKGEKHYMYGKHHTEETRAKMREKALAREAAKRASKAAAESAQETP